MSIYKPIRKAAYVYISKNFKKVFFGPRTLYRKKGSNGYFVRYKNKYYPAYIDNYGVYDVRIR
jgi:hypothetical protein